MNQNYLVIGCIAQFCIDLKEYLYQIKIIVNTKVYNMEVGSKNLIIVYYRIHRKNNPCFKMYYEICGEYKPLEVKQ